MEGGTKWEAEENREEERGRVGTYVPSLPTLLPTFNVFSYSNFLFALPPLTDRLEKATKYVFESAW